MEDNLSLVSNFRMEKLIEEADSELSRIQPEIDYLEACVTKLNELKRKKDKLQSLKASVKILLESTHGRSHDVKTRTPESQNSALELVTPGEARQNKTGYGVTSERQLFSPEQAINDVQKYLRPTNNLNYDLFKAVVYNGGQASTEEIKSYLVENRVKQPKTGKYFDDVELKDISSRANYLVRKNLLVTIGPGLFRCALGYTVDS